MPTRLCSTLAVAWLSSLAACASPPPPAAPAAEAPAKEADLGTQAQALAPVAFLEACASGCERANQMRAVGAEVIRRDCEARCGETWALPRVADPNQAKRHVGQRVLASGSINATGHLRLPGGGLLALDTGSAELGSASLDEGARVLAWGLLGAGEPPVLGVEGALNEGPGISEN